MKFLETILRAISTTAGKIWIVTGFSLVLGLPVMEYLVLVCAVLLLNISHRVDDIAGNIETLSEVNQ